MDKLVSRTNRGIAYRHFIVRAKRAWQAGDSSASVLLDIVQEIQRSCPHSEPLHLVAKVSGSFIKAGQPFTICAECQKVLYGGSVHIGEVIQVKEQQGR